MVVIEENSLNIPIPHYPPFKLRSSLIDKDPVIWVHLLEAYIQLIRWLLSPEAVKLSVASQQQLQLFLKVFLLETSEEATKIFSLGAINSDIKKNTATLRTYVFLLIKNYSVVKLNLSGDALWHFVIIYVKNNATTVRGLLDGTFTSKLNDNKKSGSISSIGLIHKHLDNLINSGKFSETDLESLSLLLGQQTSAATTFSISGTSTRNISKKNSSSLTFAETFVNDSWIELLEKLYVNGKSVNATAIKNVMVISLLSLSVAKISKLAMGLGITTINTLSLYPLFSTIIISESYKELVPNLEERLPFLRSISFDGEIVDDEDDNVNEEHVAFVMDLFPEITPYQAKRVLNDNNGNVENVTNILLENPELLNNIPKQAPIKKQQPKVKIQKRNQKAPIAKRSIFDDDKISNLDFSEAKVIYGKKSSIKNKTSSEEEKKRTLTAALRLMYESDEDEPDDTYEDQEKTTGAALDDKGKRGRPRTGEGEDTPPPPSAVDTTERHLFSLFKTLGPVTFDKTARKSAQRLELKKSTSWSDEQIEGWLRMLMRSPRRFKLLEEDFFYSGNPNRQPKPKKPEAEPKKSETGSNKSEAGPKKSESDSTTSNPIKKNLAKNKLNHNRRAGHNKKTRSEMAGMQ